MAKLSDLNRKIRMPTESVTVLRTGGKFVATKTFIRCEDGTIEVVPYKAGKFFTVESVPVACADDLFALIERLEADPHALVVGGKPRDPRKRSIQRTMRAHGDLVDAPRRFVEADLDGMPLPEGLDAVRDPEAAVRHALARMGEPWASASCRWQLSASAGMPGNERVLRARIWFWLDRPMDGAELKYALRSVNHRLGGNLRKAIVDWRMAVPNHVHYVARPQFIDMEDPVPVRSGTIMAGGALRTALLEPSALTPPPRPRGRSPAAAPHPAGGNVVRLVTIPETLRGVRADLLRLAAHLFGGPVPDGSRNDFILCWAMAAAVESPTNYWQLVKEGAAVLVPGKSEEWLRGKLSSVSERVSRHMAGERVLFAGKERTPIYTPSIRWYRDYLGLDRDTMRAAGLSTLVDDATRIKNRRAENGATGKRAAAQRRALEKVTAAEELLAADLGRPPTDGEVGALVGMGRSTVNRIRNRDLTAWGKSLQDGASEETACQQLQIMYAPVRTLHEDGRSLDEVSRSLNGDPCAREPAKEAPPRPETVIITPEVVPMPPRWPERGLWRDLPVMRSPDTRRRPPDAPAPVSDRSVDFWESTFEEWISKVGG